MRVYHVVSTIFMAVSVILVFTFITTTPVSASDNYRYELVYKGKYWDWYANPTIWNKYKSYYLSQINYPDEVYEALVSIFGIDIIKETPNHRLYLIILDKKGIAFASQHASEIGKGPAIGICYDAWFSKYSGRDYWSHELIAHEAVNLYTGFIIGGWPTDWWADTRSPFPYVIKIKIERMTGHVDAAKESLKYIGPLEKMFLNFMSKYGEDIYSKMLKAIKEDGLKQWPNNGSNPSKLLSEYVAAYLSIAANENLADEINNAFKRVGISYRLSRSAVEDIWKNRELLQMVPKSDPQWQYFKQGIYVPSPKLVTLNTSIPNTEIVSIGNLTYTSDDKGLVRIILSSGGSYNLTVLTPVILSSTHRLKLVSWDDGYVKSQRTIKVVSDVNYTLNFKEQYLITVKSDHGEVIGAGWYDRYSLANLSVRTPIVMSEANTTRHVFVGWKRNDSLLQNMTLSFNVTSPEVITAVWKKQYFLKVDSVYGSPKGMGWYDEGSIARIEINNTIPVSKGTRMVFEKWYGDVFSTNPNITILMDSPKKLVASWKRQYLLNVEANEGKVIGGGWYDEGSTAVVEALSPVVLKENSTRLVFKKWTGDTVSENRRISLIMDRPRNLIANWKRQYFVVLEYDPIMEGPEQVGWLDEGTVLTITARETIMLPSNKSRLVFLRWSDGTDRSVRSLTVNNSIMLAAEYELQHKLDIISEYDRTTGEGWYRNGTIAEFSITEAQFHAGFLIFKKFERWSGDFNSTSMTGYVLMDKPKTLEVVWSTDYSLLVISIVSVFIVCLALIWWRRRVREAVTQNVCNLPTTIRTMISYSLG